MWSRLDTVAAALTVGSRSPGSGLASRLGPGPRGPSVLPVPSTAPSSRSSSPSLPLSSPAPALLPLSTSLSPVLAPVSTFTTRARISPDTPVSARPPMATGLLFKVSSVPAALPPLVDTEAALQGTVQPGPVAAGPAPWATLSLRGAPGLPSSCASVPEDAASPKSSSSPHPGQAVSLQDSGFSSPGRSRVTRSVTFRITSEDFSAALGNPASPAYQLLSKNIRHQVGASSFFHSGVWPPPPYLCALARTILHLGPPHTLHCPCRLEMAVSLAGPHLVTQTPCPTESAARPLWPALPTLSHPSLLLLADHSPLRVSRPRAGHPQRPWSVE